MGRLTPDACTRCGGSGVIITPQGSRAEAAVCECSHHCNTCHDARYIFGRDEAGREVARKCTCEERRHRVRLYNEANVPAKFYEARLDDRFRDGHNQQAVSTFKLLAAEYHRGHKGILLMGPPGVGKTHLVCAFSHELIFSRGEPALFQDFFHLLQALRSGYSQDRPESELIEPLVRVEVLVVDELGKGRNTPWEQNILDVIISQRYNNRKTTIFTSNYTETRNTTMGERIRGRDWTPSEGEQEVRDTLRERVGTRIHSRLKEMCDFVTMLGPDRREAEAELQAG